MDPYSQYKKQKEYYEYFENQKIIIQILLQI